MRLELVFCQVKIEHDDLPCAVGPPGRDRRRRPPGVDERQEEPDRGAREGEPRAPACERGLEVGLGCFRGGTRPPAQVVRYIEEPGSLAAELSPAEVLIVSPPAPAVPEARERREPLRRRPRPRDRIAA